MLVLEIFLPEILVLEILLLEIFLIREIIFSLLTSIVLIMLSIYKYFVKKSNIDISLIFLEIFNMIRLDI